MAFVARSEYLLRGESHALPSGAALAEALYRPLAVGVNLLRSGDQVSDPPAVPGYGNGLPVLDHA